MTRSFRPSITRILVELGETNARCAILKDGELQDIRIFKLADCDSLAHLIDQYCESVFFKREEQMGLLIALAPQPIDGIYYFKHRTGWNFRPSELIAQLGLASIHILNDLESHAYAVLGGALESAQEIYAGTARPDEGPLCIIAPGTGLGWTYMFPKAEKPLVQGAMGAHIHFYGFGPDDTVYPRLASTIKGHDVMIEDVVSGPALARLRELVGDESAYAYFMRSLGFFVHSVVMCTNAVGGVVFTGGMIPSMMKESKMDWATLRAQFMIDTVPGVTGNLARIPWHVIDDPLLGLKGLVTWGKLHIDDLR